MMGRLIRKIPDLLYVLLMVGMGAGALYSLFFKLGQLLPAYASLLPTAAHLPLLIVGIIGLVVILEAFIPLMAVAPIDLVYRSSGWWVHLGMGWLTVGQLIALAVLVALTAPPGVRVFAAVGTIAVRLLVGLRRWELPRLIRANTAHMTSANWIYIQDSELLSDAVAGAQVRRVSAKRARGPLSLVGRRLLRRWYLPAFGALVAVWAFVLSFTSPAGAAVVLFIGHVVVIAGVLRVMKLGEYYDSPWWLKGLVAIALGLISAVCCWIAIGVEPVSLTLKLFAAAVAIGGLRRSRARMSAGLDYVETEIGPFSFSLMTYVVGGFRLSGAIFLWALLGGTIATM